MDYKSFTKSMQVTIKFYDYIKKLKKEKPGKLQYMILDEIVDRDKETSK
jgi:hypothetical protein